MQQQQHHTHAPRVAPHMRGHHMAMHAIANGAPQHHMQAPQPTVVAPINMGPKTVQAQAAAVAVTTTSTLQPQHLREHHHNRLSHQQNQTQTLHATSQMQKIRQQHQHLNHNNNNNNNNNMHKNHHQHQLQQHAQPYNHSNATTALPMQQQQPQQPHSILQHHQTLQTTLPQQQQQQQPPHMPHMKTQHLHHHMPPVQALTVITNRNNISKQQQQALPVSQQRYYAAGNKQKYNNNNNNNNNNVTNSNYSAPKTILQNPNRSNPIKTRPTATTNVDVAAATIVSNKIANKSSDSTPNLLQYAQETDATPQNITIEKPTTINDISNVVTTTNDINEGSVDADKTEKLNPVRQGVLTEIGNNNGDNDNDDNTILSNEDSTAPKNSKEKTPMCLVNELARYNKITHQYRLTNEKGPAHNKCFTVTLKLGEEEYSAEGFKIKKAQHLAAAEAIEKTKYRHPVPKINRRMDAGITSRANITPTVELNALAMKLGQQTCYYIDQMPPEEACRAAATHDGILPPPCYGAAPSMPHGAYMRRNIVSAHHGSYETPPLLAHLAVQQQRYNNCGYPPKYQPPPPNALKWARPPLMHGGRKVDGFYADPFIDTQTPYSVTLVVGKLKVVGSGRTLQQAKHDAAARALLVLKSQMAVQQENTANDSMDENDSKSPISMVHEIGIKRNLTVHFKVLREEGPAHMKNFITACIVDTHITEGKGNGKKISKKRAAEKMLEKLKSLPPLTPTKSPVKRIKAKNPGKPIAAASNTATPNAKSAAAGVGVERRKRSAAAALKEKPDADDDTENAITKLIQLQQNRKEKEPVFELIAKNGNESSRRREFIVEVSAHGMVARGTGNSKKLAKRNAAENILKEMGIDDIKTTNTLAADNNNVQALNNNATAITASTTELNAGVAASTTKTFTEQVTTLPATSATLDRIDMPLNCTTAGPVPGILILRQNKKHANKKKESLMTNNGVGLKETNATVPSNATETIASSTSKTNGENNNAVPATTTVNNNSSAQNAGNETTTLSTTENKTSVSSASNTSSANSTSTNMHMKNQLLYLSKLLGFAVDFSDYPKGNHNEFLTIVTLTTNPPQICHGVGTSSDESQNDAAKNALKILSELGLNNATSK